MNCFKSEHKKHRAETKRFQNCCPEKAAPAEHSWRGVLRGHVPSKSPSADGEIPCAHASGRRSKVGEKSDSFSRAERTRPLRPVSRLLHRSFENVPVERFQRDFPLPKSTDTARRVPTIHAEHLANCAQLDQPDRATFPMEFSVFPKNPCLTGLAFFSNILYNNVYTESTTGSYFRKDFAT